MVNLLVLSVLTMRGPHTKPPPYDFLNLYGACLQAPRTPQLGSNRPLPEQGILVVWAFFFDWSMESAKNSYRAVGRQKRRFYDGPW
jgi:hypothetical protein